MLDENMKDFLYILITIKAFMAANFRSLFLALLAHKEMITGIE